MIEQPDQISLWRHKNGNTYTVICLTNLESDDFKRYPPSVVYQGTNYLMWSRPLADWHRSFTKLN